MKNFKEFIGAVVEYLERRFPEAKVDTRNVIKNNGLVLHGVYFTNSTLSPTVYLENFYHYYTEGRGLGNILEDIGSIFEANMAESRNMSSIDTSFLNDFEKIKDDVVPKLINAERNEALLDSVPHYKLFDLAVIFIYCFSDESELGKRLNAIGEDCFPNITIDNEMMLKWGKTTEDLIAQVEKNAVNGFEPALYDMEETLLSGGNYIRCTNLLEESSILEKNIYNGGYVVPAMYLLSNKRGMWGATSIRDNCLLKRVAERLDCSFYIIPSSIKEVILVPETPYTCMGSLFDMVKQVNQTLLAPTEVLSDSIYFFNKDIGELTICDKPIFEEIAM